MILVADAAALDPRLSGFFLLAALPLLFAAATSFSKLSIVLSALRLGLGAEMLLPYTAVLALALLCTLVIMAPVLLPIAATLQQQGIDDLLAQGLGAPDTLWQWLQPLREFLQRHASGKELEFFAGLQNLPPEHPLVLLPAFLVTELAEGLQLAVLVLLPLLAVDLLAAQLFALLGFGQSIPQATVPLKILLFLGVGGFDLLLGGVVEGYR